MKEIGNVPVLPNSTIQHYIEENQKLKSQIKTYIEKEQMYKSTIDSIKQVQQQTEQEYQKSYSNFKEREMKLKTIFNQYQKTLINEKNSLEVNKLVEENTFLRKRVNELIDKNNTNEVAYGLKVEDYKELVKSKDNQLLELEHSIQRITKEAEEEIVKLSNKIEQLERKMGGTSSLLNIKYLSNDNEQNTPTLTYSNQFSSLAVNNNANSEEYIQEMQSRLQMLQTANDNLIMELNRKTKENNDSIKVPQNSIINDIDTKRIHSTQCKRESTLKIRQIFLEKPMKYHNLNYDETKYIPSKTRTDSPYHLKISQIVPTLKRSKAFSPVSVNYSNSDAYHKLIHVSDQLTFLKSKLHNIK